MIEGVWAEHVASIGLVVFIASTALQCFSFTHMVDEHLPRC